MDSLASSREFLLQSFEKCGHLFRISEPETGLRPGNKTYTNRDSAPQRKERWLVCQIIPHIDRKKRFSQVAGKLAHRDAFPLNLARHDFARVVALNYAEGTAGALQQSSNPDSHALLCFGWRSSEVHGNADTLVFDMNAGKRF